jgi:hypothetical protein
MIREWDKRKRLVGALVFGLAFVYLYWIAGDVLRTAGDEGIYLEGGRRVALGEQPYRDFFAFTGPLTFWIQGILARASGMSLAIMQVPAVFDVAFLAWLIYWLTSHYAGALYSAGTALAFLAIEAHPRLLVVNHRWDSAALAMAAIAAALSAHRNGRREIWAASGFLLVAAAWATPPMLLVGLPLFWWCARSGATSTFAFLGGGTLAAGAGAAFLQWKGALGPMIQSMSWVGAHYARANRVPYGSVWLGLAAGPQPEGWRFAVESSYSAIPALLPPVALLGWAWYLWWPKGRGKAAETMPLLAAAVMLALSAWPRWTALALQHTAALSWFLCALLFYRISLPRQRFALGSIVLTASVGLLAMRSVEALSLVQRETRVGLARATTADSDFLEGLERRIEPGDSVFSFPYMPSLYYYLNARNPSRYSFLQPGMMTLDDEQRALAELRASPPRWVVYERFPLDVVLAIWPGSDPVLLPVQSLNSYLAGHYRPVDEVSGEWGRVQVMERVSGQD